MIGKPDKLCPLKYSKRSLYLLGEMMSDNFNKEDDMKAEDEVLSPKHIAMQAITGSFQTNGEGYDSKIDLENHIINKIQDYADAYHQSQLQALKKKVEELDTKEISLKGGMEEVIVEVLIKQQVLNLITNLEDNGTNS